MDGDDLNELLADLIDLHNDGGDDLELDDISNLDGLKLPNFVDLGGFAGALNNFVNELLQQLDLLKRDNLLSD